MTDIAEKAWEIIQAEHDRLLNNGVDSTNAKDLMGKDAFSLDGFNSWKPSEIEHAKNELLKNKLVKKNVFGEFQIND